MTVMNSLLHFLVDGVCAWAMLGPLRGVAGGFLVYNFCAFALQLPLGILLDRTRWRCLPGLFTALGCVLTLAGALWSPAVLGLGNALFHVGGGVEVIREDAAGKRRGALLGVFVAPGALGLYMGGLVAGRGSWLLGAAALMAMALWRRRGIPAGAAVVPEPSEQSGGLVFAVCFAVVVLRSYVGLAASFPWKAGALALAATGMVVLGKVLGGVLAARLGGKTVTVVSLLLAAAGFALGEFPAFGLMALLCFNMTMPLTLYALWRKFPAYPGAAFGALTFGLFLGFVPVYFGIQLPMDGIWASILSLLLLWNIL